MIYRFEDCLLDERRRELRRGPDVISLEPKAFDLLCYLVRHRDRMVTHDELFAAVWEGRVVSMSTLGSTINSARAAIGDSGGAQRLIQTLPRKGFRFVKSVSEVAEPEPPAPAERALSAHEPTSTVPGPTIAQPPAPPSPTVPAPVEVARTIIVPPSRWPALPAVAAASALGTGLVVGLIYLLGTAGHAPLRPPSPAVTQQFDASVVPLITDEDRRTLATYPSRPELKVLAIGSDRFSVVDNATDIEKAKQQALQQCSTRGSTQCRIYAVGMNVVMAKTAIPLADRNDLRTEPLGLPLILQDIPTLDARRRDLVRGYMKGQDHRALAITTGRIAYATTRGSRTEAARLAVERCSDRTNRPCLVISVDGQLTVQLPKTHKVDRVFLPSVEHELSDEVRTHVARVYGGREWRALARGKKGSWHAVADAPTESAAVDSALKLCSQADEACRLYAIGNFGVARTVVD